MGEMSILKSEEGDSSKSPSFTDCSRRKKNFLKRHALLYKSILKAVLPLNYYHAEVGVLEILYGVGLMTSLGLLTIGSQTLKTARTNPAEILRNE